MTSFKSIVYIYTTQIYAWYHQPEKGDTRTREGIELRGFLNPINFSERERARTVPPVAPTIRRIPVQTARDGIWPSPKRPKVGEAPFSTTKWNRVRKQPRPRAGRGTPSRRPHRRRARALARGVGVTSTDEPCLVWPGPSSWELPYQGHWVAGCTPNQPGSRQ